MAHSAVQEAIADYLQRQPSASNEEVAEHVRAAVPGSSTTAASVSSVKSRLRQNGSLASGDQRALRTSALPTFSPQEPEETDDEAAARISVRYRAMERLSKRAVAGRIPALIVSGPPGLGKSYTFRQDLKESGRMRFMEVESQAEFGEDPVAWCQANGVPGVYDTISGSITAVGLYQALWYMRKGGVILLDDCDAVFAAEDALNLLKSALDSDAEHRHISWRKEARWLEEYGIPKTFLFEGSVVFLTNIDFETVIARESKMSEHYRALIDRSHYLCLTLRSQRDFMLRIRAVACGPKGMLVNQCGLTEAQGEEIMAWVEEHKMRFYNLSLRLVTQCADVYKTYVSKVESIDEYGMRSVVEVVDDEWKADVFATKTRTYS